MTNTQNGMEEKQTFGQNPSALAVSLTTEEDPIVSPQISTPLPQAPVAYQFSENEQVHLAHGTLEYCTTDFVLPGRNGFDLNISRVWQSQTANEQEMQIVYSNNRPRTGVRENNHDRKQYGLGFGWRFVLPSIEIVPHSLRDSRLTYVDHLHLQDGRSLELCEADDGISFGDYVLQDVTISALSGILSHPQRSEEFTTYDIVVSHKTGHKDYFKKVLDKNGQLERYTLTARTDRFDNAIFYDLILYGGMRILDTWGREVLLSRYGDELVWKLPAEAYRNPRILRYRVTDDCLVSFTDALNRTTHYEYYDPTAYRAQCRYFSEEYGDDTQILIPWRLLKSITHPSGAVSRYMWGWEKEAQPLRFTLGEYGGYKQIFPLMRRWDEVGGTAFQAAGYTYRLAADGTFIRTAEVVKPTGLREICTFDNNDSHNHLLRVENWADTLLVSATDYVYGEDENAADYRLCTTKTVATYGTASYSTVYSFTYSADKKADLIRKNISRSGNRMLDTVTSWVYDAYSQCVETCTQLEDDRYVLEKVELDESREKRVPSYKRVYERIGTTEMLREKTQYIYGEDEYTRYCVVEQRDYNVSDGESLEASSAASVTRYAYDSTICVHKPVAVTRTGLMDAYGSHVPDVVTRTLYDGFGNTVAVIDAKGNTTEFSYDAGDRLICEEYPPVAHSRSKRLIHYDDKNNFVTTVDELGNAERIEYSPLGLPLRRILAHSRHPERTDAVIAEYVYDTACRLSEERVWDGEGIRPENLRCTIRYQYDHFNRLLAKEIPETQYFETHMYDNACPLPFDTSCVGALHQITVAGDTSSPSQVKENYFDCAGNAVGHYASGQCMQYSGYDRAGRCRYTVDARDDRTDFILDYAGRVTELKRQYMGVAVTALTKYDALGQKVSESDFLGNFTRYEYDTAGRLLRSISPFDAKSNAEKVYRYDVCGRVSKQSIRTGAHSWTTTSTAYDARGRVIDSCRYTDAAGNHWRQTHTEYDAAGHAIAISTCETGFGKEALGQTQRYTYDRFGNVLTFTDAAGKTEYNVYDKCGRLLQKTLRDGTVQKFTHDAMGRMTRVVATKADVSGVVIPVAHTITYTRTGLKREESRHEKSTTRVFSMLDFNETALAPPTISYRYDSLGRLVEQVDPDGTRKVYEYDATGNRTRFELWQQESVAPDLTMCYTYDNFNRLTELFDVSKNRLLSTVCYDANGRRTNQTYANGTTVQYAYNAAGLVTEQTNTTAEGAVLSRWSYEYRLDGLQTAKTNKDGLRTAYAYDLLGQLVKEEVSVAGTGATVVADESSGGENNNTVTGMVVYSYDDYGNRTAATATGYPAYSVEYTYDAANRLLSETRTQDGETVTTVRTYDADGRLLTSATDEKSIYRVYDGFGSLVRWNDGETDIRFRYRPDGLRHTKRVQVGGSVTVTTHHWDGDQIVQETSGNETVKASYYRSGVQLVMQRIGENDSFYLHNSHGDVVQRVDGYGNVLKSYEYDAFGNILNPAIVGDTGAPLFTDQSPFGYCGEYLDKETGELYLRARYYDPATGNFTCEDPIRNGSHAYAYCNADPINRIDPSGMLPVGRGNIICVNDGGSSGSTYSYRKKQRQQATTAVQRKTEAAQQIAADPVNQAVAKQGGEISIVSGAPKNVTATTQPYEPVKNTTVGTSSKTNINSSANAEKKLVGASTTCEEIEWEVTVDLAIVRYTEGQMLSQIIADDAFFLGDITYSNGIPSGGSINYNRTDGTSATVAYNRQGEGSFAVGYSTEYVTTEASVGATSSGSVVINISCSQQIPGEPTAHMVTYHEVEVNPARVTFVPVGAIPMNGRASYTSAYSPVCTVGGYWNPAVIPRINER